MYIHVHVIIHVLLFCDVLLALFCVFLVCFSFSNRLMIQYVSDPEEAAWRGYFYAALMFIAAVIQSILLHQYFHRAFITGMRIRTAVVAAVYKKVLKALISTI